LEDPGADENADQHGVRFECAEVAPQTPRGFGCTHQVTA
jgi:hypothetical protein